jgi:hypothetical protein
VLAKRFDNNIRHNGKRAIVQRMAFISCKTLYNPWVPRFS